jgi:cytochrome P450
MGDEFDPWSPEFVAYPYHAYERLRRDAPVTLFAPTGQYLISRYTDVNALLRDRPGLLPGAVEELMRYDTPLQMFERWVLEEIVVRGVRIPRGTEVALLFGSANHDPEVFAQPERLDLARTENPHLSFGAGVHYCLGAPLARIELVESFGTLLRLAAAPRLGAEPRWKPGYIIRGLESLEIEFG